LIEQRETTGPAQRIRLTADRTNINADRQDVAIITVEALDDHGRLVPTANNMLAFRISGAGQLIGVGNGNPNCLESDKEPKRSLFNGLAQVIVQSTNDTGSILIEAVEDGSAKHPLRSASLVIKTKKPASKDTQRVG
jgi:beta-galactosidase